VINVAKTILAGLLTGKQNVKKKFHIMFSSFYPPLPSATDMLLNLATRINITAFDLLNKLT
jgi:hypothetical protein